MALMVPLLYLLLLLYIGTVAFLSSCEAMTARRFSTRPEPIQASFLSCSSCGLTNGWEGNASFTGAARLSTISP